MSHNFLLVKNVLLSFQIGEFSKIFYWFLIWLHCDHWNKISHFIPTVIFWNLLRLAFGPAHDQFWKLFFEYFNVHSAIVFSVWHDYFQFPNFVVQIFYILSICLFYVTDTLKSSTLVMNLSISPLNSVLSIERKGRRQWGES